MVLSTTKRTSSVASIVNQNSGGGSKKAGLPYQIGRESSVSIAFHKTSQYLFVLRGKRYQLQQLLAYAIINLAKLTEIKTAADALVASKIDDVNTIGEVTVTSLSTVADINALKGEAGVSTATDDALDALIDAITAAETAQTNVTAATGIKMSREADLNAYTAPA